MAFVVSGLEWCCPFCQCFYEANTQYNRVIIFDILYPIFSHGSFLARKGTVVW